MTATATTASGAEACRLVLGTNVFGWTAGQEASHEILSSYVDGGGNFIDTADSYSFWGEGNAGGESERIIGSWLSGRSDRDQLIVATKVSHHPEFSGMSPENIRVAVEESLRRLGTECIDLYYAHFDDPSVPLEQSVQAMSELVDQGKIRSIGVSNYSSQRIEEWISIAKSAGYHVPIAIEPQYNLMERAVETDILPLASKHGLDVYPYYSLAHGFLSGKYRPGNLPQGARTSDASQYMDARGLSVLAVLDEIAKRRQVQPAAIAVAWIRGKNDVTAPIASARNLDQLSPLLSTLNLVLDEGEVQLLDEASRI